MCIYLSDFTEDVICHYTKATMCHPRKKDANALSTSWSQSTFLLPLPDFAPLTNSQKVIAFEVNSPGFITCFFFIFKLMVPLLISSAREKKLSANICKDFQTGDKSASLGDSFFFLPSVNELRAASAGL